MDPRIINNSTLLAQSRPSGTSAVSAYAPLARIKALITQIVVCNTTGGSVNLSIYLDADGTTYDQTTALYYTVALAANSTLLIPFTNGLPIANPGNLAVQTSSANALTFSIIGLEITK